MKGDHLFEEVKLQPTNAMFSKLHSHSPHSLSPLPHHPHSHPQQQLLQLQNHQHNNTSEEDESSGGATGGGGGALDFGQPSGGGGGGVGSVSKKPKTEGGHSGGSGGGCGGGGGDGASIEVSRRPRGRPPGSKNKPKPPIIITRDTECAMRPHILEISSGLDIIDAMARFARQRNVGLCVLTASGTVVNVSLRQPSTTPGSTVTFHGRFDILSISATYLPPGNSVPSSNGCTITLAGPQGQIFGGSVVGALIAASNVFLVATSFSNPTYHRLPIEEDDQNRDASESQSHSHSHQQLACTPPPQPGLDHQSNSSDSANALTIYNCTHLPTDGIWTPTARPPPPSQHF